MDLNKGDTMRTQEEDYKEGEFEEGQQARSEGGQDEANREAYAGKRTSPRQQEGDRPGAPPPRARRNPRRDREGHRLTKSLDPRVRYLTVDQEDGVEGGVNQERSR
jgi:hypothetical protein